MALAAAGAKVAVSYLNDPPAAALLVSQIQNRDGEAFAVAADVGQEEQVIGMFQEVMDRFGGLDILVNTAGIRREAQVGKESLADWELVLRVNLTGHFLCAREAIARFVRQGVLPGVSSSAGKILSISSVRDHIAATGNAPNAASQGGVSMLMRAMAREAAVYRVRVNNIAPGAIRTPGNRAVWDTPAGETALLECIPYGRMGEVDDVARAAVWLVSDAADYVTGVTLYVDGGMKLCSTPMEAS